MKPKMAQTVATKRGSAGRFHSQGVDLNMASLESIFPLSDPALLRTPYGLTNSMLADAQGNGCRSRNPIRNDCV
jgi:hypothetical protein